MFGDFYLLFPTLVYNVFNDKQMV